MDHLGVIKRKPVSSGDLGVSGREGQRCIFVYSDQFMASRFIFTSFLAEILFRLKSANHRSESYLPCFVAAVAVIYFASKKGQLLKVRSSARNPKFTADMYFISVCWEFMELLDFIYHAMQQL